MKKTIKSKILGVLSVALLALGGIGVVSLASADSAFAAVNPWEAITSGWQAAGGDSNSRTLPDYVQIIINVLLFIIGAIAVIMIIIGGIRYVTSSGDSNAATSAKNTILYAVVGLVVALLAYAIVNFVIGSLK